MYRVRTLTVLLCVGALALVMFTPPGTVYAGDQVAAAKPDKPILTAKQDVELKWNLRFAARMAMWKGKITRADFNKVQRALEDKRVWPELSGQIAYMAQQEANAYGTKPVYEAPGGWLAWLLENLPAILQMITQLIDLFSQVLPPELGTLYADTAVGGYSVFPGANLLFATALLGTMPDQPADSPSKAPAVACTGPVGAVLACGPLARGACAVARVASWPARAAADAVRARRQAAKADGRWYAGRGVRRVLRGACCK